MVLEIVDVDLKPCAHCGGLCRVSKWGGQLYPGCPVCGYTITGGEKWTFEKRAEVWNARAVERVEV